MHPARLVEDIVWLVAYALGFKKRDAWRVFGWLHRISFTYLLQEVVTLPPTSSVQGFYITSNANSNWTSISNLEK
jgi:hypothetical protein